MSKRASISLGERLAKIRRDFETGDTPAEIVQVFDDDIERLLSENVADLALKVGQTQTLDSTVQAGGKEVSLKSLIGERFLVLTWFRGNW